MNKRKIITGIATVVAVIILASLIFGLTTCSKHKEPEPIPEPTTTTTTTATTTTTKPPLPRNPLTGIQDFDTENNRPVAFAVPDESSSIVQVGIEHAEMYFEAETEAGIPRMLAIFSSVDRLPERIGPVRSARPHFIKYVNALDAIYCHIGGSGAAREAIRNQHINDVEAAHEIDPTLAASDNYSWNRKAFIKSKLLNAIDRMGYKTTSDTVAPYDFGKKKGDQPAATVNVKISHSYNIGFSYDKESGNYYKHRVTAKGTSTAMDMPIHETGSGGKIAVKNVIVMYDNRSVLDYKNGKAYHIDFELKQGTGTLAVDGTARDIVWKRTDAQLSFYEADGKTPLKVGEGKTFVCLTDKNLKAKTVIE